ncbi:hypothetical protein ABH920_006481 [Catenulispora sp. EB89]|uniref:carbohydrate binding domain-containing protein n=1 Tax=Catenulispora sp. EB89 TaxID=3156257 RepID=UPI0035162F5D
MRPKPLISTRRLGRVAAGLTTAALVAIPIPAVQAATVSSAVGGTTTTTAQSGASTPAPAKPDPQAALRKSQADAHAKAVKTGKPVIVDAATTPYAMTVANPDGTFSYQQTVEPVRAKVGATWSAIDTSLAVGTDGKLHTKATPVAITVSDGGTGVLAAVDTDGKKVSISWPGTLPKPTLSKNSATYPEIYPGVDLEVSADSLGVREVLVVKSATAAANPALAAIHLGIDGAGVKIGTDSTGAIVGTDAGNNPVFTSHTPLMWDSTQPATRSAAPDPVAKSATPPAGANTANSGNSADATAPADPADGPGPASKTAVMPVALHGSTVDVTPDAKLLRGATTVYPVYVDPQVGAPIQHWAEIYNSSLDRNGYDTESCCTNEVVRVGNSSGSGIIRSMVNFKIDNSVFPENSSIADAVFKATTQGGASSPCAPIDLYTLDPFNNPATWRNQLGTGGANSMSNTGASAWYSTDAKLMNAPNGQSTTPGCGGHGNTFSVNVKSVVQPLHDNYHTDVTFGLKANNESTPATAGYAVFYRHDGDNGGNMWDPLHDGNMQLLITYRLWPRPVAMKITPSTTGGSSCDTAQPGGYIAKTITGTITATEEVEDIDPASLAVNLGFNDLTVTGKTGYQNNLAATSGTLNGQPASDGWYHYLASASFGQDIAAQHNDPNLSITDGHAYGVGDGGITDNTYGQSVLGTQLGYPNGNCFFTAAFNSPNKPTVSSTDFPAIGSVSVKTATQGGNLTIGGTTTGVPIDHYDWVLNRDSSQVGVTSVGGATLSASGGPTTTLALPTGLTTAGENTLWIRAVDRAGNFSPVAEYDFYTPGNPNHVTTLGDVTGQGVPDIVMAVPDGHGASHLVVLPGNTDPALPAANLPANIAAAANEAAPASAAPDGKTWDNTLITHRGAERGVPVDDLFAAKNGALYYYLNAATFGGTVPADQFAVQHQVVVTRPSCNAAIDVRNQCAGYRSDWSGVKQILAFGAVGGQDPGTFAGKTNLITVEDDGNGGANLWLFKPVGVGQVTAPVMIGSSNLTGAYAALPGWNWLNMDLIAAGKIKGDASNGAYPDLWARDRTTGNLWQFDNTATNNVEDPYSLGNLNAAHSVGPTGNTVAQGPLSVADYPVLVNAGSPAVDSSGTISQTGYPALWGTQPDGQLKLLPGSANGPVTTANAASGASWSASADDMSRNAWTQVKQVRSLNGQVPTSASGPIRVGYSQQCLDLPGANTNNDTALQQYSCLNNINQAWTFGPDGSIRWAGNTNKCLTIRSTWADNYGTADTSPLTISDCVSVTDPNDPQFGAISGGQRFVVRQNGSINGYSQLYNPASGRCLDNEASTQSGVAPWLWDCAGSGNTQQAWLVPVGSGSALQTEAETLWQSTATGGSLSTQTNCCGVTWSNNAQEMLSATAPNATMTLSWYVPYAGTYSVKPAMTSAVDYGTVTLTVDAGTANQAVLPQTFDGYHNGVIVSPFTFGTVTFATPGVHTFTFTVKSTNAASTGNRYNAGVDTLVLRPASNAGPTARAQIPSSAAVGSPMTVDASTSIGGAYAITGYTFAFGDGTAPVSGTAATASHTYTTPGTYTTTTTVTDFNGGSATTTNRVTVLSSPAIPNGDFESGTLSGWTASYNAATTTSSPHTGTYAGQITAPTGGTGSIEQVLTGLAPNTSYTLTGWVRTDGGSTILGVKQYDPAGDNEDATTTATGWTQLSDQFTTGASNTSVDIYCYRSTAGTSACDDITLLATPPAGGVANPDFETGNLAGWNAAYNAGVTTTNPHSGTYAGQINAPTGGNGSIEQVVSGLIPNTSYTLTGWVRTDGGSTILGAKQYDPAGDNQDATTTATGWTQLSDQFTTGANNTSADIYCYRSTAGSSACDDITLTQTAATIANPDFEAGSLAGWTAAYNAAVTTTNPHSGTYAGQINAPAGGTGSIEQVVNGLTPNTTYTLTGWILTDGGVTNLGTKKYSDPTGADDTGTTTTATTWTQLTTQFTTGPTNTSVDIYCYRSTAGTSACDDITLTKN